MNIYGIPVQTIRENYCKSCLEISVKSSAGQVQFMIFYILLQALEEMLVPTVCLDLGIWKSPWMHADSF
jgi:hypothetical protein